MDIQGCILHFQIKKVQIHFLKMDGRAVFDFAIRDVAKSIKQTIDESPRGDRLGLSATSSG